MRNAKCTDAGAARLFSAPEAGTRRSRVPGCNVIKRLLRVAWADRSRARRCSQKSNGREDVEEIENCSRHATGGSCSVRVQSINNDCGGVDDPYCPRTQKAAAGRQ
jgi:hypothetical protein